MIFSDEDLMVMFAAGVKEAFDMLYERYRHRLYGFAMACLQNPSDAEDAVQDVFLSIARSAGRYEPRNRFHAWLFQIAANRIRSVVSRKVIAQRSFESDASVTYEIESATPSADTILMQRDGIRQILGRLSADQRMIFLLREVEGMSIAEIAHSLKMSSENVRVSLHRARKRITDVITRHREMTS